jgi:hypothetical protein
MQIPINYLAVVVAAVAGFLLGWGWYSAFGKVWMAGLGKTKEDCDQKPSPIPFIIAAVSCLLMAWMLAGLMGHLANVTVKGGLMSAFFVWAGFVLTTTTVNQIFRGTALSVTLIDVGNWLAVLVVMGVIIGAFGT